MLTFFRDFICKILLFINYLPFYVLFGVREMWFSHGNMDLGVAWKTNLKWEFDSEFGFLLKIFEFSRRKKPIQ